jgi:hypothetical protein
MSDQTRRAESRLREERGMSPAALFLLAGTVILIALVLLAAAAGYWRLGPHIRSLLMATEFRFYVSAVIGVLVFLLYYHGLFPHLVVSAQIEELVGGVLRVRLQVENKSDVAATKEWARFQILDYVVNNQAEWLLSPDCRRPDPIVSGAGTAARTEWVPITTGGLGRMN